MVQGTLVALRTARGAQHSIHDPLPFRCGQARACAPRSLLVLEQGTATYRQSCAIFQAGLMLTAEPHRNPQRRPSLR